MPNLRHERWYDMKHLNEYDMTRGEGLVALPNVIRERRMTFGKVLSVIGSLAPSCLRFGKVPNLRHERRYDMRHLSLPNVICVRRYDMRHLDEYDMARGEGPVTLPNVIRERRMTFGKVLSVIRVPGTTRCRGTEGRETSISAEQNAEQPQGWLVGGQIH